MNNLRVERGNVLKLTPAMAATVWLLKAGHQETLHATLSAGQSLYLGPYLNITEFRYVSEGAVTIENQAQDFQAPVSAFNFTPPTNNALPTISGTTTVGETLTSTTGSWMGNSTITYAYQWNRDGVAIDSATDDTYYLVGDDEGAVITCSVTATNTYGSGVATSAGTAAIAPD